MQMTRRAFLPLLPAGVAAIYVACSGSEDLQGARVKKARENGGQYLLREISTNTDRRGVLRSSFALALLGWGDRIRLQDGSGIESVLDSEVQTAATAEMLEEQNARLFVSLGLGRKGSQNLGNWEGLLANQLVTGQMDNNNNLLVNNLVLSQRLAKAGWYSVEPEITSRLRTNLGANRTENGWGTSARIGSKADQKAITDITAWVVEAGVADKRELDKGRSGPGWRLFVDQVGDKPTVESTVSACWALGTVPTESLEFILSAQREDGAFRHKIGEDKDVLGATVEAVALLSSKL